MLLIAQTSSAQYDLAIKGDRVKYDSAVVVELGTYRKETRKLNQSDSLITRLRIEVRQIRIENDKIRTVIDNNEKYLLILEKAIERKDKLLEKTRSDCEDAIKELGKTKWYERKEIWLGLGFLIGSII